MQKEKAYFPEAYSKIKLFKNLNFGPILDRVLKERELKKLMTPEQKYEEKKKKYEIMLKYGYATVSGLEVVSPSLHFSWMVVLSNWVIFALSLPVCFEGVESTL